APVRKPDGDVEAEDSVWPGGGLHPLERRPVMAGRIGQAGRPVREGMGPGGRDAHALSGGERDDLAAELGDVATDLRNVPADAGPDLHDGLVHLRLDAFLQEPLALVQDLLYVRAQLTRLRIDDLELLLDAEGKG